MIRLRSFKKKDHSNRRLLLILAITGSFLHFYLMYADRLFWCSVSVSFLSFFPLYAPLESAAVLQSGNDTSRLFVASRYGFGAFCHPFKEGNFADLDKPAPAGHIPFGRSFTCQGTVWYEITNCNHHSGLSLTKQCFCDTMSVIKSNFISNFQLSA